MLESVLKVYVYLEMMKRKIRLHISEIHIEPIEQDQNLLIYWKRGHKFTNQGVFIKPVTTGKCFIPLDIHISCTLFTDDLDQTIRHKYLDFVIFKEQDEFVPWLYSRFDLSRLTVDGKARYLSHAICNEKSIVSINVMAHSNFTDKEQIQDTIEIPIVSGLDESVLVESVEVKEEKPSLYTIDKNLETGEEIIRFKLLNQ